MHPKLSKDEHRFIEQLYRRGVPALSIADSCNDTFHQGRHVLNASNVEAITSQIRAEAPAFVPCANCTEMPGAHWPQSRYSAGWCHRFQRCMKATPKIAA